MIQVGTLCWNSNEISTKKPLGAFSGWKTNGRTSCSTQLKPCWLLSFHIVLNWALQYNPFNHGMNLLEKSQVPSLYSTQEASSHSTWNKQHQCSLLASGGCNLPPVHPSAHKHVWFGLDQGLQRTFSLSKTPDQLYLEICGWSTLKAEKTKTFLQIWGRMAWQHIFGGI